MPNSDRSRIAQRITDIPFFNFLTEAINFCIQHSIFPDRAKIVSIDPLDKRKQKKRSYQVLDLLVY